MDRNRFSFMMLHFYFQTTTMQLGFLRLKSECKMTMIYGNCTIQTMIVSAAPVKHSSSTTTYNNVRCRLKTKLLYFLAPYV